MPTYDYVCTACGHRMEVVHGIHGHHPDACPACGATMRKGFTAPTVHFKGSGWAKKDRGAAATTKAAAKAAGGEPDAGSTKSDRDGSGPSPASSDKPPGDKGSSATESKAAAPKTPAGAD